MESQESPSWLLRLVRVGGRALLWFSRPSAAALAVAWMALIWTLSSSEIRIVEPPLWLQWLANLFHAPLFGILGLLLLVALLDRPGAGRWPRVTRAIALQVILGVLAYGIVDEWHQSRTKGRMPTSTDVVTDVVGAICVVWVASYITRGDATGGGLGKRLGLGILACATAAGLATLL